MDDSEPPCLIFACHDAGISTKRATELLRPYFPPYAHGLIDGFNDHWRTKKRDVLALLDAAALGAEETRSWQM
jgi:hypothetical protein